MLARYKNWVKNAEAPDEEDFCVLPFGADEKRKKALVNLGFSFVFLLLQIVAGSLNPSSSRTVWIFYPYIVVFLPIAYFFSGALFFMKATERLSRKVWEKSLARCRHSGVALLVLAAVNALLELVFILLNRGEFSGWGFASGAGRDVAYFAVFLCMTAVCVLYGIFFDRSFSKSE